jgi:hypothetical protein
MGIYSSGNNYRRAAQGALASAKALTEEQSDIEFRRQLLSNIRQERIARAQLEAGNYSDDFTSSSAAGATANIDSSLAGESIYAYEASKRAEQIQNYQQVAQNYMKKYKKQQKTRAMSFAVTGMAAGAVLGGIGAAALGAGAATAGGAATGLGIAKGALIGAQIGQGAGQIASGTGQTQQGIQNILGGIGQAYRYNDIESNYQKYLNMIRMNRYELASVDPSTNQVIPGSQVYAGNYQILQGIRGY